MRPERGFTLVELLVVTAISVLILTVGSMVYMNCMKVYEEGQGMTQVYETAKLMERDLRDSLSGAVGMKGSWVTSCCLNFPGGNISNVRSFSYYTFGTYGAGTMMTTASNNDAYFSGPQMGWNNYDNWNHVGGNRGSGNYYTLPDSPENWGTLGMALWITFDRTENSSWWPPAFYGQSDGTNSNILAKYTNEVGSWGWPRPDYRLDADADDPKTHSDVACWFYSEDRDFNSPLGLTLDNPNVVLVSLKFSKTNVGGREQTGLSILKHHIGGWDQPGRKGAGTRGDMTYGEILRSVKITPYFLSNGNLVAMTDTDLGVNNKGAMVPGGNELPRCFDVRTTLRNPWSHAYYTFAYRFYTHNNPQ